MKGVRSGGLEQKSTSWSEAFPLPTFLGIRRLGNAGDQIFFLCPRPFRGSAFPAIGTSLLGSVGIKGNVLRTRFSVKRTNRGKLFLTYFCKDRFRKEVVQEVKFNMRMENKLLKSTISFLILSYI